MTIRGRRSTVANVRFKKHLSCQHHIIMCCRRDFINRWQQLTQHTSFAGWRQSRSILPVKMSPVADPEICGRGMGVNATGTLGVAGRAPKTRESRRRRRRGVGLVRAVPLPRKFMNFSSQNGVIWCILGVLFLRFMCPMDCSCMINFTEVAVCA